MTKASGAPAPRNRHTNKMDDQSNKQPNDPQPYQRSAWMYWLSTAAALALVLLVLMYVLRRYRGSRLYNPSGSGSSFIDLDMAASPEKWITDMIRGAKTDRSVTRRSK